ncbi:uncharacterized protein LACBIDRAFT_334618 [Laccaria bicolor S238N-H82]|uniref:Predicted protein n=1 Tax=Laccaria bicolor (strain S238N-H82 / ATCC MYA-4686) TaxID=486041 RepID=B0DZR2_LACBS|nr:uncharacterized protein LACBIDRAFT_334618 [Laccaria bicolor S238N-H82]EDQ99877.1 predicted protein [Laccaria bicolor S238N-H82]|eukprot:XP_001889420.1 predicted protein [Laccaria bicolor S238N-H82]
MVNVIGGRLKRRNIRGSQTRFKALIFYATISMSYLESEISGNHGNSQEISGNNCKFHGRLGNCSIIFQYELYICLITWCHLQLCMPTSNVMLSVKDSDRRQTTSSRETIRFKSVETPTSCDYVELLNFPTRKFIVLPSHLNVQLVLDKRCPPSSSYSILPPSLTNRVPRQTVSSLVHERCPPSLEEQHPPSLEERLPPPLEEWLPASLEEQLAPVKNGFLP